jgi:hypothetical protein
LASSIDQIVSNNEHVTNNIDEQQSCTVRPAKSIPPNNKVMKKKPGFAELLHKYQRIAKQKAKQSVRLTKVEFFITKN